VSTLGMPPARGALTSAIRDFAAHGIWEISSAEDPESRRSESRVTASVLRRPLLPREGPTLPAAPTTRSISRSGTIWRAPAPSGLGTAERRKLLTPPSATSPLVANTGSTSRPHQRPLVLSARRSELIDDWLWIEGMWSRVGPAALRAREKFGEPRLYENFEALAKR
jgi:hypothetical protein